MNIWLIIILGIILRLINLDKPEGLWNDEYVSWYVASTPIFKGFWQEIIKQCHMPLYYFYLKPFTSFNDITLRLTSLIPSVLSIYAMFLTGKLYSKTVGNKLALLTAVSSFLIYYSQEVRFYSLLFLLTTISLYFTIKLVKSEFVDKKTKIGYILSTILILFTHVLGFIYVGFNLLYVLYRKKKIQLKTLIGVVVILLSVLPMGLNILKMLPSSQWWGSFSYTNILFLFSDFFSPILTNNINAPKVFYYSKHLLFIALITTPTIISFIGLILGAKKEKGLACISLGVIVTMSILALCGKIVFITKYSIEILPIFLLLVILGFEEFKIKRVGSLLLTVVVAFQIFAVFTPYFVVYQGRSEGHKIVGDMLNNEKSDIIIYTYYDQNRFKRYFKPKAEIKELHISKINRFEYLNNPKRILDKVRTGEKVTVVFLDSVSFIPDYWIENARAKNMPEMFITFSIIKNSLINEIKNNYKNIEFNKKGSWSTISGVKYK